jgi:hypothetical protein
MDCVSGVEGWRGFNMAGSLGRWWCSEVELWGQRWWEVLQGACEISKNPKK